MTKEWSIQEVARAAATTSRTLRHYDDIGLLRPSRVGDNGYRYYDEDALAALQRVLLLRELGLGLPAIADVMAGNRDHAQALSAHLRWLEEEKDRLDRQIASVELTMQKITRGDPLMAEEMFDGFDHTAYRAEVEQRWGVDAYSSGDAWWTAKSPDEKSRFRQEADALARDWIAASVGGVDPTGAEAMALARRQRDWIAAVPGTPPMSPEYLVGLGEMYVADERLAANYGGAEGAGFVRDALAAFASTLN